MGELQPDLLGGKAVAGRRTPKARKNGRIKIAPQGHADKPGTGPAGETCGGCSHMVDFHFRRTFHKCDARAGDVWKGGRATDIRPLDAACSKFCRKANALPAGSRFIGVDLASEPDRTASPIHWLTREEAQAIYPPTNEELRAELGAYGGARAGQTLPSAWLIGWADGTSTELVPPSINGPAVAEPLPDAMVRALRNARTLGLTVDELAALIAQPAAVVRPRLSELHKAGKVRKAPERRPGAAGRSLAVWLIKEEGEADGHQPSLI